MTKSLSDCVVFQTSPRFDGGIGRDHGSYTRRGPTSAAWWSHGRSGRSVARHDGLYTVPGKPLLADCVEKVESAASAKFAQNRPDRRFRLAMPSQRTWVSR